MPARLVALMALLLVPLAAPAKGPTVKIEVRPAGAGAPIEITEPDIVRRFSIWNGPGVTVNGRQVHMRDDPRDGRFIDWPRGTLPAPPPQLERYEVTFHIASPREPGRTWTTYLVTYAFEPGRPGGFVYLPRLDELPDAAIVPIVHFVEGNWFHSSAAWEKLVRPLLEARRPARVAASPAARGSDR